MADSNAGKAIEPKEEVESTDLPEDVTEEPRNAEEMHLKLIKNQPSVVKSYLAVSDDTGKLLQEKALEKKVTKFCAKYSLIKKKDIPDPEMLLAETKSLATVYTRQINFRENTINGTICKYRIRQGVLFLIMKKAVKAAKKGWEEWFIDNFKGNDFRSAQDAMKLAKAKSIIKYAFLGKFRLLQILRQIDDYDKQDDPVGSYLEANGVDFNPKEEINFEDIKFKVTVAINHQKLIGAGFDEISKIKVEALVKNGREVESIHIRDMKLLKQEGVNVVSYFDKLISDDTIVQNRFSNEQSY